MSQFAVLMNSRDNELGVWAAEGSDSSFWGWVPGFAAHLAGELR